MIKQEHGLKTIVTRYFVLIATLAFIFSTVFGVYFVYLEEGKIATQRNEIVRNKITSIRDNLLFLSIINDLSGIKNKIETLKNE